MSPPGLHRIAGHEVGHQAEDGEATDPHQGLLPSESTPDGLKTRATTQSPKAMADEQATIDHEDSAPREDRDREDDAQGRDGPWATLPTRAAEFPFMRSGLASLSFTSRSARPMDDSSIWPVRLSMLCSGCGCRRCAG